MGISAILMILALICFLIAAIGAAWPENFSRFNLIAWGLFFWVLAIVIGGGGVVVRR